MEENRGFLQAGHAPTLLTAFLYFDVSFMIWVLLGAIATFLTKDFHLSPAQQGFMVGIPTLGGALLRIPMGMLGERFGGKKIGLIGMLITALPLLWGYFGAERLGEIYCIGLLLGVAGASFAVALPMASRWYPPRYQGLVMGITAAGNVETILSSLFSPHIAAALGWHAVFALALIPLCIVFLLFAIFAKDSPKQKMQTNRLASYLKVFRMKNTWLFSFFYSLSFGGFVGFTSYLALFFVNQYSISKVTAGNYVTLIVLAGSFVRPIGGYLADKFGGSTILRFLFACSAILLFLIGLLPNAATVVVLLFVNSAMFGMANGSLFQLVPTQFPKDIGIATGIIGAMGGFGGFFLPNVLGSLKSLTHSYAYGFWLIALVALMATVTLLRYHKEWNRAFAMSATNIPS